MTQWEILRAGLPVTSEVWDQLYDLSNVVELMYVGYRAGRIHAIHTPEDDFFSAPDVDQFIPSYGVRMIEFRNMAVPFFIN